MNQATKQDLRQILGKFLTGVTVVTTLDQHDVPVGFTANSFPSVSLDPPLVLVCLAQSAGLAPVFRRASSFAFLAASLAREAVITFSIIFFPIAGFSSKNTFKACKN